MKSLLCSDCFKDEGLKLDALQIGVLNQKKCPNCKSTSGSKLSHDQIGNLAYRFFVRGTLHKSEYGAAPIVQFNNHHYGSTQIQASEWLKQDLQLIEQTIQVGFFYYGPNLWMLGEVEPLKDLQDSYKQIKIIDRIISEYPVHILSANEVIYRLRLNPHSPSVESEYDSPPYEFLGKGRLDSKDLPILYASQDLEVCIHECRTSVEDEVFFATLEPKKDLKLLDLTEVLEEDITAFESLDMAVHMLFCASKHAYNISQKIALAAKLKGFDGIIYPSYFSHVRTGAIPFATVYGLSVRTLPSYKGNVKAQIIPNIALFGRPVKESLLNVKCINRLVLNKISYGFQFGPVES